MNEKNISRWIRAGLWALPVSWLVTAWSTLEPQPDQEKDPAAWATFVSSGSYQFSHLFGSTAGTILAIFGVFALGCCLANSRIGRLALAAMVTAVAGTALLLVPAVISTFATPAIGKAYLAGNQDVMLLEFPGSMTGAFLLGLLLAFLGQRTAGNLGVAFPRAAPLGRGTLGGRRRRVLCCGCRPGAGDNREQPADPDGRSRADGRRRRVDRVERITGRPAVTGSGRGR